MKDRVNDSRQMRRSHTSRIYLFALFSAAIVLTLQSFLAAQDTEDKQGPLVLLIPSQEAVISSRVNSQIDLYKVEEGDSVKKGETVVELDKEPFELQRDVYTARLAETEVQKKFYDAEYVRFKKLFDKRTIPETKYDEMKFKRDQTNQQLADIGSMLKVVKLDIKYCNVKAPFDGRLTKHIADIHEFVKEGDPIFKIINDETLHAVVHFKSSYANQLKKGKTLLIRIDETGKTYNAKIVKIAAEINAESRTFQVEAAIDNKDGMLRAGMMGVCLGSK